MIYKRTSKRGNLATGSETTFEYCKESLAMMCEFDFYFSGYSLRLMDKNNPKQHGQLFAKKFGVIFKELNSWGREESIALDNLYKIDDPLPKLSIKQNNDYFIIKLGNKLLYEVSDFKIARRILNKY